MHSSPRLQVPQLSILSPQPSAAGPHSTFCTAHVLGTHVFVPLPHLLATGGLPTPQASPGLHSPQATSPPQPSGAKPQSCPAGQVVAGSQVSGGGTHEPRSKIMYSSSFSCGVIGSRQYPLTHFPPTAHSVLAVHTLPHWAGKILSCSFASSTWKSLNNTRPHCNAGGLVLKSSFRLTGVL